MGFFAKITKTVDLGGGNTVVLRKATTGEDIEAASAAVRAGEDSTSFPTTMRYRLAVLKRTIVSWDGPDFDGQPVTPENIEALPSDIGRKLMEETVSFTKLSTDEGN